jgi:hypothetical protein
MLARTDIRNRMATAREIGTPTTRHYKVEAVYHRQPPADAPPTL